MRPRPRRTAPLSGAAEAPVPALLSVSLVLCLAGVPCSAADRLEAWPLQQRLVTGYTFIWYIDGATHKCFNWNYYPDPAADAVEWTWQPHYPKGAEPDAAIFGLDDPRKWPEARLPDTSRWPDGDDMLWHMAELRAWKFAGLDYVFVDLWPKADFRVGTPGVVKAGVTGSDGSPAPELQALFDAWRELDRRGEQPVKLASFLDTPGLGAKTDARTDSPDGAAELWEPTRLFYRQFFGEGSYRPRMPIRALAARQVNGKPHVITGAFIPRLPGARAEWVSLWDTDTWASVKRRFRETFGTELYVFVNQHLHGPRYGGWEGPQADGSTVPVNVANGHVDDEVPWFACLQGPLVRRHSIAISAGYFKASTEKRPAHGKYPLAYRYPSTDQGTSRFERDWRKVLGRPASFKRRQVVIETLNELQEGTGISPCKPTVRRDADGQYVDRWGDTPCQYLKLCARYAAMWKSGRMLEASQTAAPSSKPHASKPRR